MGLHFTDTIGYMRWYSNPPYLPITINSFTAMGWCRLDSDHDTYRVFFQIGHEDDYDIECVTSIDGTTLSMWAALGFYDGTIDVLGKWFHWAIVGYKNTATFYLNGYRYLFATHSVPSAVTNIYVGGTSVVNCADGQYSHYKIWNIPLSPQQIAEESRFGKPSTQLSNLWAWYPFERAPFTTDWSGQGHHLKEANYVTSGIDAPIPWAKPAYSSHVPGYGENDKFYSIRGY